MFQNNIFFTEQGKILSFCFYDMIYLFALHFITIVFIQYLNELLFPSIINQLRMRKKYVNTNSQPNLHDFNFANQDSYSHQNSVSNNRIAPITHTPSIIESGVSRNKISRGENNNTPPYITDKNSRMGQQINKMEDWMTDIYNKRRNQNQFKKNSNSTLNYSNVSIANQSRLKLPAINTPPILNQESKLVEQIRRVQNRIKQLKFQRNLASSQQQKYQTIRPFIQLQNQNMMNMQLMMSMAQQNKTQQHHCCNHNQNNAVSNTRIVYVPFPQQQQNMPYQQPYQHQSSPTNYYNQQSIIHRGSLNKFKNKQTMPTKKNYNFQKIRKFRICVIAVYFYLLFPKFVNKFSKKRFRLHQQKYFNKSKHHQTLVTLSFDRFSDIDYYKVSQSVEKERKQRTIRRVTNSKTAKLIISEQNNDSKKYEIFLGDLQVFLLTLLKNINELIRQGQLDELIKDLSVGYMPYSFPLDYTYLYQQMYRLKFHPNKTYLQINQLQAKSLIMVVFFVKLLVYDYLFVVREDIQWKKKFLKKNNFKKSQMIQAQLVTTQMYISGILLHQYCMEILQGQVKDVQGNLHKIQVKNIPVPMGAMMYQSKEQIKNDDKQKSQQQQIEDNLFQFNYIKNLGEFETLTSEIRQKSGHEEQVKELISDLTDQIYKKSIQSRNLQYQQITASIIQEQKYLISKNKGFQKLQFQMPKRTNDEKEQIKSFLKQMKQDKHKQDSDDGSYKKQSKKLSMKNIKVVEPKGKNKRK